MANPLASDNIWFSKYQCEDAERTYQERLSGAAPSAGCQKAQQQCAKDCQPSDLVSQIAKAREQIQKSLDNSESAAGGSTCPVMAVRLEELEQENQNLREATKGLATATEDLKAMMKKLENRIAVLEGSQLDDEKNDTGKSAEQEDVDDDDDIDLFGSDSEEDEEAERLKEERLKQYADKKSKKTAVIAKSSVLLDVKSWGDEIDPKDIEQLVRGIEMDGLRWGASKILTVAFGVKKLQIMVVVEDDKVSIEALQEQIEGFEDLVQSTDIVAFNKI